MAEEKRENLNQYFIPSEKANELTGFYQENQLPGMPDAFKADDGVDIGFQNGAGVNFQTLDVATPCVYMPAVIVVMAVPLMYIKEDGQATPMAYLIKDLIENHARQATGFDINYTLETQQAGIGNDGQEFQVPGKTKRSQPTPSFTFPELQGNLVINTIKKWIFDINHPDTNAACAQAIYPGAWTMSAYSMSVLLIQYDQTMRPDKVIDGVYYTNMWPTGTGDFGYERVIGTTKHPERNISFTAIAQHNDATKALAVAVAEQLQLHKHNYNIAPTARDGIQKTISEFGYWTEHKNRTDWAQKAQDNLGGVVRDPTKGQYAYGAHLNDQATGFEDQAKSTISGTNAPQQQKGGSTPWYEL